MDLPKTANQIRQDVISMIYEAGSGHPAGSLGMADIFTALYFEILKHDPAKPDWEDRDRLILSNGRICPVQYASMARAGYFSPDELKTLRKFGSRLQGHPERKSLPGLETTSGPLGCGLSQACGIAWALLHDKKESQVFCLMSDTELDEGNVWEAIMFADKYRLGNLIVVIDRNNIQSDGGTEAIMPLDPIKDKFLSFGWQVAEIDGHNFEEILGAFREAKEISDDPTVIIAHTIPGKGVSFMEGKYQWHSRVITEEDMKKALEELKEKTL